MNASLIKECRNPVRENRFEQKKKEKKNVRSKKKYVEKDESPLSFPTSPSNVYMQNTYTHTHTHTHTHTFQFRKMKKKKKEKKVKREKGKEKEKKKKKRQKGIQIKKSKGQEDQLRTLRKKQKGKKV